MFILESYFVKCFSEFVYKNTSDMYNFNMFFSFILSLSLLIIALVVILKIRPALPVTIRILTIAVFLSLFVIIVLPEDSNKLMRLYYTLQSGTLDADYELLLENLPTESYYRYFATIILLIAPFLFGGFILSFFEVFLAKCKYYLLRSFYDTYYFSDLNEKSLLLAKDIIKTKKRSLVVFCNQIDNGSGEFLMLPFSEKTVRYKPRHNAFFFELSDNESRNIENAQTIINNHSNYKNNLVKIFVKANSKDYEFIFDSMQKGNVEVRLICEAEIAIQNLFFETPLFEVFKVNKQRKLNVLIIGDGLLAENSIKQSLMYGQLGDDIPLTVTLLSDNAMQQMQKIKVAAPELFSSEYDLAFHDVCIESSALDAFIENSVNHADYIIVCMDDDTVNFHLAVRLRSLYARLNTGKTRTMPYICCYQKNTAKALSLQNLYAGNENYSITPFGMMENLYSYKSLVASEIERLALNAHAVYTGIQDRQELLCDFYKTEINRRSCRANVIHLKYKLYFLGFIIKPWDEVDDLQHQETHENIKLLQEMLENKETLLRLGVLEHERWNAFQRGEGWQRATVQQALAYSTHTKSHKDPLGKLHPCLCDWNELVLVEQAFNKDFKEYDFKFLTHIPDIFGFTSDTLINVSGVKYALIKF